MATTHIHLRDTRDRLIDLLGLGQTCPLRDLAVSHEKLTVAHDTVARIPIEDSQLGVLYQLHRKHQLFLRPGTSASGPAAAIQAWGNGGTIELETHKITEDITFEILAQKQKPGRQAYLHQTATVKVGLNAGLRAWIPLDPPDVSCLDATLADSPPDTAPRIVDYGSEVEVVIANSQEGVRYELVRSKGQDDPDDPNPDVLSQDEAWGNLSNITLRTGPIHEDTNMRILATRDLDLSGGGDTRKTLLKAVLAVRVRANPGLSVSVTPPVVIDYNDTARIKVTGTQRSVNYQLYVREIFDAEFIHDVNTAYQVIKVDVEGEPTVQVLDPAEAASELELKIPVFPEGFVEWGDARDGSGGELELEGRALTEDSLVVVQARKNHKVSADHQEAHTLPSAVELEHSAVILVRPDPTPSLKVEMRAGETETSALMQVVGGQPGVFYYFRPSVDGDEFERPAYFHKRDDQDKSQNKGVGKLMLDVDFVVVPNRPPGEVGASEDPALVPPAPPLLDTGPLSSGTTLYIRAMKAQTRVAVPLTERITL